MENKQYTKAERILMIEHGVNPTSGETYWPVGDYSKSKGGSMSVVAQHGLDHPEMIKFWGEKGIKSIIGFYQMQEKIKLKNSKFQGIAWNTTSPEYNRRLQNEMEKRSKK